MLIESKKIMEIVKNYLIYRKSCFTYLGGNDFLGTHQTHKSCLIPKYHSNIQSAFFSEKKNKAFFLAL